MSVGGKKSGRRITNLFISSLGRNVPPCVGGGDISPLDSLLLLMKQYVDTVARSLGICKCMDSAMPNLGYLFLTKSITVQ